MVDIHDGCFDIAGIVDALEASRTSDRPTFINVRTVIGLDSKVAGTANAHGAAFGAPNVAEMKKLYGFDPEEHFVISDEVRDFFAGLPARGDAYTREWEDIVGRYEAAYPELGASFRARVSGELSPRWRELVPGRGAFPEGPTASRASSGLVLNPIARELENFMVGTADLSPSVHMIWPGKVDFQHVSVTQGGWSRKATGMSQLYTDALIYSLTSRQDAASTGTTPGGTSTTVSENTPCVPSPTVSPPTPPGRLSPSPRPSSCSTSMPPRQSEWVSSAA